MSPEPPVYWSPLSQIELYDTGMFSFKGFSDPKLQTSSLSAYQAARNLMWAKVSTRLWVIVFRPVPCSTSALWPRGEFTSRVHVKHSKPKSVFLGKKTLSIFRTAEEKTKLKLCTTHHPGGGHRRSLLRNYIPVGRRGMCRKYVSWQTSVIGSFACSERLNKGDPRSGRCRPTSNRTAYLYLCFSSRDQRATLSSGVYWRQNPAKSSCGWPVCKYGCCQPNCSPCWQWFLGLNLCLAQRTQTSLGGGLQPNRGLFRQNRQCLSTADTELAEVERNR